MGYFNDHNVTNCTYNEENLITSFTTEFYEFSCPDNFYYSEERPVNYEYFDGYVVVSANEGVSQIDLNENGNLDTYNLEDGSITYTHNITYDNNYINSISRTNGYYEMQFTYENGNLINIDIESDYGESGETEDINITYTQYENKSKLFHPFLFSIMPYFPIQNFYGKNNTNLPETYIRNRYNSDGELIQNDTEYYNYIFDDDGYVIFLEVGNYSDYQNQNISNSLIEKTFEITYTN